MKVLWIVNMVLPDAAAELGVKTSFSGSWLIDPLKCISQDKEIELATMTYGYVEKKEVVTVNNVRHYVFPGAGKRLLFTSAKTEEDCQFVLDDFQPDLIHIYGTEYSVGYSMLKLEPKIPVLLTIQGILTHIAREYHAGLPWHTYYRLFTMKQLLRLKLPLLSEWLFRINARRERKVVSAVKYITGRTEHDREFIQQINPAVQYFRLNYNLREEFYQAKKWDPNCYVPHTIFTGAAGYPLKGLHKLIDAVAQVKEQYPDVQLIVPGNSTDYQSSGGYERYLRRKIRKLDMESNVQFVGRRTAKEMIALLQTAHVYAFPSAYDTDSLSLCEAQLLGVPTVASKRGGSEYLVDDQRTGLCYDFEDTEALAESICSLFADNELCQRLSQNAIRTASERHNREINTAEQIALYWKLKKEV